MIRSEVAGLAPVHYSYDASGLLMTITSGNRVTTFGYDASEVTVKKEQGTAGAYWRRLVEKVKP